MAVPTTNRSKDMKIAVLDDWQHAARGSTDWSGLERRAELAFFHAPFADEDAAAAALKDFEIIMAMRERTPFPASLISRLPKLQMFNLTGKRARLIDMAAMTERGITVCTPGGGDAGAGTAELALALMLAVARGVPRGDAAIRAGRFQAGTTAGIELAGKTLGLIGLGRIGQLMARYGAALDMRVLAWSENLTEDRARAGGAAYAPKDMLLAQSDVVSVHMVLSPRSAGILGALDIAAMKPGAILINTSRSGLVDQDAMLAALHENRISAGLDVFDIEPLPPGHPMLAAPNTVLTPHIGYGTAETFGEFYRQSIENVAAFLDGAPINLAAG
jgi:phosphoglycerate dehydrogenase-like enzyme